MFVTELYRTTLIPSNIPLERYIQNFVQEIPLPPEGLVQVQYSMGEKTIMIARSLANDLPLLDVPMEHIFHALDIDNILILFNALLCEKQVLLHSTHLSLLGTVAETLCALLFPFKWHHIYIPLLPQKCLEFLQAPGMKQFI